VLEFILHACHSKLTPSVSDKVLWRCYITLSVTRFVGFDRYLLFKTEHGISEAALHCTSGERVGKHLPSFKEIRYKSAEHNHGFW